MIFQIIRQQLNNFLVHSIRASYLSIPLTHGRYSDLTGKQTYLIFNRIHNIFFSRLSSQKIRELTLFSLYTRFFVFFPTVIVLPVAPFHHTSLFPSYCLFSNEYFMIFFLGAEGNGFQKQIANYDTESLCYQLHFT